MSELKKDREYVGTRGKRRIITLRPILHSSLKWNLNLDIEYIELYGDVQ